MFERIGEERHLGAVCDAPAVLMRLDLARQKKVIRWEHGEGPKPEGKVGKTFYKYFSCRADERRKVARMRECLLAPSEEFLKRYFVWLNPLLPKLTAPLRYFFDKCYPDYDLGHAGEHCFGTIARNEH